MFKFATNKFIGGGGSASGQAAGGGGAKSAGETTASGGGDSASAAMSRRRMLQKDLFSFNKIADKGFPSKPSAMDYDRKLRLLALGTKNGDIRIYGAPGTCQQQISSYQDVHPFPILRLLFVQGQHQIITLSERVQRNDLTNRGESQLYLVLWQIPDASPSPPPHTGGAGVNLVEKIKEYQLDPKIVTGTRLSAITLLNDNSHIFLGFETGDVYVFNVATFKIVPGVINKDYILKNLPEPKAGGKKLAQLGAVESICHHPRQLTKLLLAYQRGLWVIFDFIKNQIDHINQTAQQLESAVFYQAGECIATAHSDGSFILWDLESAQQAEGGANSAPNIVYGPYPCKAVSKCLVKTCRNDQPYVIFSGGCPRVNYSDKITISVIQGEKSHVCFDFTSKIIEFFTIDKPNVERAPGAPSSSSSVTYDNPQALLVLLEEEFVAIDLMSENWPQFKLPYLYSVHSSAIICTHYVNSISAHLYERLKQYGSMSKDLSELYSDREWPITCPQGSQVAAAAATADAGSQRKDLLLTGHEDGSISFWDVTHMSMTLIYRLRTSDYFQTDSTPLPDDSGEAAGMPNEETDIWPPFRKVGTFDPYSDDPKLGIQKIYLCAQREILVAAGTAGQVLIMYLNDRAQEIPYSSLVAHKINIIGVSPEVESHFVWKGHEPLALRGGQQLAAAAANINNTSSRSGDDTAAASPPVYAANGSLKLQPGYQLHSLIQLYPPATVSALTLNSDWQLVGIGTSHGFVLYDYHLLKDLLVRCTLDASMLIQQAANNNNNDSGNSGTISRRKSLKKSLRESFRKLRRGRSQAKPNPAKRPTAEQLNSLNRMATMRTDGGGDDELADGPHRPIERQVESREFKPMDDIPPSVIRYMYFVRTFITSSHQQTNSLWVGTNTGVIYIYALQFLLNPNHQTPGAGGEHLQQVYTSTLRSNQSVNCLLAKEMRLKHKAPVVHIQVIDQNMQPLPAEMSAAADQLGAPAESVAPANHKVIICSEEQFKVFQLPTLKPVCKFKLTAIEGARVRRIGYNSYTSRTDPKYSEYCLSCLSNLGDLSVYSLPQLKRQVQIQCMKQQDINAITSFVFSKQGQAFYLQSPSEFIHISMSAKDSAPPSVQSSQSGGQKALTAPTATAPKKQPTTSSTLTNGQQQQQPQPQPPSTTPGNPPSQSSASKQQQQQAAKQAKTPQTFQATTSAAAVVSEPPAGSDQQVSTLNDTAQPPPVPAPRTLISASATTTTSTSTSRTNEPTNDTHNNEQDAATGVVSAKEKVTDEAKAVKAAKEEPVVEAMERLNVVDEKVAAAADTELSAENVLSEQQSLMAKSQVSPAAATTAKVSSSAVDPNSSLNSNADTSNLLANQSAISSSTANRTNPAATTTTMRNVNSSLLIGGDSFNASTSCVGVVNSGVDLSLDSVVPYGDNEHQTSMMSKKAPQPQVEEDSKKSGGQPTTSSVLADDYNPDEDDDMIVSSNLLIKPPQTASSPLTAKGSASGHIANQPGLNGAHSVHKNFEKDL